MKNIKKQFEQIKWSPNAKWLIKKNKKNVKPLDDFYGRSMMAEMYKAQRELNWAMNEALFGDKKHKDRRTKLQKLLDSIKSKISDFRVWLAEMIGGDNLHDGCY